MVQQSPLVMILAGGQGARLYPLTKYRSKPSVPFGGPYRMIDFTLSNCVNSGFLKIFLLTQYKSLSLSRHLREGWSFLSGELGQFMQSVPPQLRAGRDWYEGTANAFFQNIYLLQEARPRTVLVLSGDHVYRMDYRSLLERHEETGADLTIATYPVPPEEARRMGVIQVDGEGRMVGFVEKPKDPQPAPGMNGLCLGNMGVYVFRTEVLVRGVTRDAKRKSSHDFGKDVIPDLLERGHSIYAYPLPPAPGEMAPYWMDIGTLDAYHEAALGLLPGTERFPVHSDAWPLRARPAPGPPAVVAGGNVRTSILSWGVQVLGGRVRRSILSPDVVVERGAVVEDSVLMDGVRVGRGARVVRSIIDKQVSIPPGFTLDGSSADGSLFTVSPGGVTVVPKRANLEPR